MRLAGAEGIEEEIELVISSPKFRYTDLLQAASGGRAASRKQLVKRPGTFSLNGLLLQYQTAGLDFHELTMSASGR